MCKGSFEYHVNTNYELRKQPAKLQLIIGCTAFRLEHLLDVQRTLTFFGR
jgi:hypothetical protein